MAFYNNTQVYALRTFAEKENMLDEAVKDELCYKNYTISLEN